MEILTSRSFVPLLVVLAYVTVSEAQTENKYFKVGGTFELRPVPVSGQISSIVWKYDKNLLAEWAKDSIDLEYYSKFKDRSELNTTTGVLVVHDLTAADKGVYSVEINNQVQSRVYQTVEIVEVPQPAVEVQPLACSLDSEKCQLACLGGVDRAGPVEYSWRKDDGEWEPPGEKNMELIKNKETQQVKTFSCRMKNPVSEKESRPKDNPFYQESPKPDSSSSTVIVIVVVLLLLAVIIVGVVIAYYKITQFKNCVDSCLSCKKQTDQPPSPDPKNNGETDHLKSITDSV